MQNNINISSGRNNHISDDSITYVKLNDHNTFEGSSKKEGGLDVHQSKQNNTDRVGRNTVQKSLYQSHKNLSNLQHLIGNSPRSVKELTSSMGGIIPTADETLKMPAFKSVGWGSLFENLGEFKYIGAQTTVKPSEEMAQPTDTENKNKSAEPLVIKRQGSNVATVTWANLHTV